MSLVDANQSQLIRSSQKDEYYQTYLRNNANEAFHTLAGSKRWLDWRKEIELFSDLAYYGLTTFSGYQTLGEEYVNIIQVDPSKRRVPSRARRGLLVLLHTLVPYLLDKVLVCLENELEAASGGGGGGMERRAGSSSRAASSFRGPGAWLRAWVQRAVALLSEPQRKACVPAVLAAQQALGLLHRLHVAVFYLSGAFYHLAKRSSGVSYLRVLGVKGDDLVIRNSYRLLGAVSLLQLALTVGLQINSYRQRQRARREWKLHRSMSPSPEHKETSSSSSSSSSSPTASRCILCLEERRHSTCTPCGHLFCWECITEWCNTKTECPLCREKFQPHRLIYLRNYK